MTEERHPEVEQAYRELGAEEPPRALDEAVLAASRRAVDSQPAPLVAPGGRRSGLMPLAAAAVLALSIGVTLHMQMEQPDIGAPAPAPVPPAAPQKQEQKPTPSIEEQKPAPSIARPEPQQPAREKRRQEPMPFQPAPRADRARDAQAADQASPAAVPPAKSAGIESAAAARSGPRALQAPAAMSERSVETPERELERIAELRRQGRHDEADKALAEFRKRHPQFRIPEATLERVERR